MSLSLEHLQRLQTSPPAPLAPVMDTIIPKSTAHHDQSIAVNDVAVAYGGRTVIENINLSIRTRHITVLLGPSGCGKSSLLNCFNRMTDLIAHCSIRGSVLYRGEDIFQPDYDVRGLRKKIGMIFQRPNPFPFSIRRNIDLPLKEHGIANRDERRHILETVLQSVGLWPEVRDRLESPALQLSGGQQQRLCIARALALAPEVLLMDEPCSALDPMASSIIEELIIRLRGKYTIVLVTHNLFQAQRIADDVGLFWLREGRGSLVEFGDKEQIFSHSTHELTRSYINGICG